VKADNEIEARPYNIFVFPRERPGYSPQIMMDVSAIEFNSKNNMSWDTWIYNGNKELFLLINLSIHFTFRSNIYDIERSKKEKR